MPLAIAAYSFYALTLVFGFTLAGASAWIAGLAMSFGAGIALGRLAGARPVPVRPESAKATFRNGVLDVMLERAGGDPQ